MKVGEDDPMDLELIGKMDKYLTKHIS